MLDQASVSSWEAITALDAKNFPVDEDVPEKQQYGFDKRNENIFQDHSIPKCK
jgi:hypothetical protein